MNNKRKKLITDIALSSIFIAVIVVSAQITVPMPYGVPVTLQTLTVALCGYCLGAKRSISSVAVYILMGIIGIPVFSNFNAGLAALVGKTGGFIWGFIPLVAACGLSQTADKRFFRLIGGIIGLACCHLIGIIWFMHLTGSGFIATALMVSVPFLIKDVVCVVVSELAAEKLKRTRVLKN